MKIPRTSFLLWLVQKVFFVFLIIQDGGLSVRLKVNETLGDFRLKMAAYVLNLVKIARTKVDFSHIAGKQSPSFCHKMAASYKILPFLSRKEIQPSVKSRSFSCSVRGLTWEFPWQCNQTQWGWIHRKVCPYRGWTLKRGKFQNKRSRKRNRLIEIFLHDFVSINLKVFNIHIKITLFGPAHISSHLIFKICR